jgi:hypothetical protein
MFKLFRKINLSLLFISFFSLDEKEAKNQGKTKLPSLFHHTPAVYSLIYIFFNGVREPLVLPNPPHLNPKLFLLNKSFVSLQPCDGTSEMRAEPLNERGSIFLT